MTKKHYEAIASILLNSDLVLDDVTHELADYFATDNKNFNREMFLTACGVEKTPLELDRYERQHQKIQNWGEQHPDFHTKEHMAWLKKHQ